MNDRFHNGEEDKPKFDNIRRDIRWLYHFNFNLYYIKPGVSIIQEILNDDTLNKIEEKLRFKHLLRKLGNKEA